MIPTHFYFKNCTTSTMSRQRDFQALANSYLKFFVPIRTSDIRKNFYFIYLLSGLICLFIMTLYYKVAVRKITLTFGNPANFWYHSYMVVRIGESGLLFLAFFEKKINIFSQKQWLEIEFSSIYNKQFDCSEVRFLCCVCLVTFMWQKSSLFFGKYLCLFTFF